MNAVAERAVVAWALLLVDTLILGTTAFSIFVAPTPVPPEEELARTFAPLWRILALLALVLSPLALVVETADMAGVSFAAAVAVVPQVLRETHVGEVWRWSLPVTVALPIVAWLPGLRSVRTAGLCLFAALLLLSGSLVSHAVDSGALALAAHFIHQMSAAVWLGSVVGLWLGVARGGLGPDWVERAAPRVSRVAGWTVALLILTGLLSTYWALGMQPHRLVDTAYGRTLLVKVSAASLVLLIGAYNRYWLISTVAQRPSRSALLRNVSIESVLLMAILGLAAVLANTPPGHHQ